MITQSGRRIDMLEPDPAEVRLPDVAIGLAQPRYSGQAAWSIAQHSVLVGTLAQKYATTLRTDEALLPGLTLRTPPEGNEAGVHARLAGLLHDGHEAFIGDTPGPLQAALRAVLGPKAEVALKNAWRLIESRLDDAIWVALCRDVVRVQLQPPSTMDPDLKEIVRLADLDALLLERSAFWWPQYPRVGAATLRGAQPPAWHSAAEGRARTLRYVEGPTRTEHKAAAESIDLLLNTATADAASEHANLWLATLFECLAAYDRTPNLEP